jgi:hypothetical protein
MSPACLPNAPLWLNDRVWVCWKAPMRINDVITKCAVFVGEIAGDAFVPIATGFFVGYPVEDGVCQYLVTAQHCVMGRRELKIRINTRNGQSQIHDLPSTLWHFHPDASRFVDVAVIGTNVSPFIYDIVHISLRQESATDEILAMFDIGVGDDVFFPGLFIHHSGQGRNLPIIRMGTIAAMPHEPITTRSGSINAYLIEGRSIGGHSGSPVFVNMDAPRLYSPERTPRLPPSDRKAYYLLGLIRGHLKAKDSGEYVTTDPSTEDLWVNSGIATVIPVQDIWETLNQPDLDIERMRALENFP